MSVTKLQRLVLKNSKVLQHAKHLRKQIWIKLLPEMNQFYSYSSEFLEAVGGLHAESNLVSAKDKQ